MKDKILKYLHISKNDKKNIIEFLKITETLELNINNVEFNILSLFINGVNTYDMSTYLKIDEVKIYHIINDIKLRNNLKNDKELVKKFISLNNYYKEGLKIYKKFLKSNIKEFSYNDPLLDRYLLGRGDVIDEYVVIIKDDNVIY